MISEELMSQVQRYMKTRSFALNENLKEELAVWLKAYKGIILNKKCGTCLRNGMRDVSAHMQQNLNTEIKPAKITFIGTKQYNYDTMSYNDMKALAKDRGLNLGAAPKKADLLNALKS
jgi:hypothetical protein